jgi:hypothetical protein
LLAQPSVTGLLVGLGPFLERIEEDAEVAISLADMRRDASSVHQRFTRHDEATVEELRSLRIDVPEDSDAESEAGAESLAGNNLRKFDAIVNSASEVDPGFRTTG